MNFQNYHSSCLHHATSITTEKESIYLEKLDWRRFRLLLLLYRHMYPHADVHVFTTYNFTITPQMKYYEQRGDNKNARMSVCAEKRAA